MAVQAHQYTIRGVPEEVDRVLRAIAKQRKVSLNQLIVEELTKATIGRTQKADFSDLAGRWIEDPKFDALIEAQRAIHPGDWR